MCTRWSRPLGKRDRERRQRIERGEAEPWNPRKTQRTLKEALDQVLGPFGDHIGVHVVVAWETPEGDLRMSLLPTVPPDGDADPFVEFLAKLAYALANPEGWRP